MTSESSAKLRAGARVRGLLPGKEATVVTVEWHGDVATVVYRDGDGLVGEQVVFPDQLRQVELVDAATPWGFDADPEQFWLALEARRIRLASLFDPVIAVHSSLVEPLPHQIIAVYEEMLPRQPLRFLLADDPGAGKTIMAGLLIKELIARGDLERCLIICPGSLAEQWQDELHEKFRLPFDIATNDKIQASHSGNWFNDVDRAIARIDKLARDDAVQDMLSVCHWDLVIVDEAHKMSAHYFGSEKTETKRYKLGKLVSPTTRNFLLMSATPHNGKEEDFQLFLALLDGDRFEGRFREGVHVSDPSDLMRRMVKEQLLRFDGTPLFPERRAYVLSYELTPPEQGLYAAVTDYVCDEFNRAENLEGDRRSSVGFALTLLQRRLASSPEAIYQSLRRRRERLESDAREAEEVLEGRTTDFYRQYGFGDDFDEDDLTGVEQEEMQEEVLDRATAAKSLPELRAEISTLQKLERMADEVRRSGQDRKWSQLRELLLDDERMVRADGSRRKLVIFTEHRDTLRYLQEKIADLRYDNPRAVITIVGGMARDDRRKSENAFRNDPDVEILLATDAAGEGINLQRAHLMVNYDLPWNPNRLEQRFGRIHRIGQDEVCHLWNMVAVNTREGDVYQRLLGKLETARQALGGGVFDVLGQVLQGQNLRDLMIQSIRYGEQPEVKAKLLEQIDNAADQARIRELLESDALARDSMDTQRVQAVREDMERAHVVKMQPYYVEQFFRKAFGRVGGQMGEREPRCFEVRHVPAIVRARDRMVGVRAPVLPRYERVTFEKRHASPKCEFVCPGHPLLESVLHLTAEHYGGLLRNGSVLVDDTDVGETPWALVTLEHTISDPERDVSKRVLFIRVHSDGRIDDAGFAPHVDLRPPTDAERSALEQHLAADWLRDELERSATAHAMRALVPAHMNEVQSRRTRMIDKTLAEVKKRLTHEINHWDRRAAELREQVAAGKQPRMNVDEAERRAEDLTSRLRGRMDQLERQRHLACGKPAVTSGCFVAPRGMLDALLGREREDDDRMAQADRDRIDRLAVAKVMQTERDLGRIPKEMPHNHPAYDIESRVVGPEGPTGELVFLEVKGKAVGRATVTVSANQINASFNKGDQWILAIVPIDGEATGEPVYARRPFDQMVTEQVLSTNFKLARLAESGGPPS